MSDIELCEICEERPGVTNSLFWKEDDDEEGIWVCEICEHDLELAHREWAEWTYGPPIVPNCPQ